jgi:hypothetical protein
MCYQFNKYLLYDCAYGCTRGCHKPAGLSNIRYPSRVAGTSTGTGLTLISWVRICNLCTRGF